ncbi:MAG: DUF5658 family protein [Clostridiales bacterium]|nr:DUF5658 family protein [Clostridiales bacterium]
MQYIIVFAFSVLDHIFTCLHLSFGVEEKNIIWRWMLENMLFWQSFIIRNSLLALALFFLYLFSKKKPVLVKKA